MAAGTVVENTIPSHSTMSSVSIGDFIDGLGCCDNGVFVGQVTTG